MERTALIDVDWLKSQLRVIVIKDMFDWYLVVCTQRVASLFEYDKNNKGENLHPWPTGSEFACIRIRLSFEPKGSTHPEQDQEFWDAAEVAAQKLREKLGILPDDSFIGAGI
jgi:hypothetical protein